MKALSLILIAAVLGGCVGYRPDQRVVGTFVASGGETVEINPDGWIVYAFGKKVERVGLVSIAQEAPLTVRVIAPDTSPWIGSQIVFSADRSSLAVDWQNLRPAGADRPREFHKQGPAAPAEPRRTAAGGSG
jgi:hypothetical protein